jgi:type I restriction enzyme R subunit
MSRNEAQTRFELIDPALERRGWSRTTDIRLEETLPAVDIVYGKGRRRPKGRTDYVLRRPLEPASEPMPLGIIEAKREDLPPEHGLQQGRSYRVGQLHHVPFVFSSNGHQFVEYDEFSGATSDPRAMADFPTPQELIDRYLNQRGLTPSKGAFRLLLTSYAQGRDYLRYYQDAAIRSALEKIIRDGLGGLGARVLLALSTGSGKTRIAAALIRRLFDSGVMGKALFVCDRTELRDNGLGDFQAAFGNDAAEVDTGNPQKNARVLIATYQTLDHSKGGEYTTFFTKQYPPGYFDVIVIDECHRSAWGDWFGILESNPNAIQIGLTATPREIRLPETHDDDTQSQIERDRKLLADNLRYFGEPVYEYSYIQGVADGYLAPADLETYDLFHDGHEKPERVRGVSREDVQSKTLTDLTTGKRVSPFAVAAENSPSALESRLVMPDRVKAMCEHLFERLLVTGDDDPLQKTIVFCASDHHADLVANKLNGLYGQWCRDHGQKRVHTYAFKCMASSSGQALIPDFRNRQRSHIIATTKDLLTTGVNVPCVRNIVFFRYVQSPILFHQMIGRGTRIHEESGKLMFRVFDYTGATVLFGADFISPPSPPPHGGDGPGPTPPPPPPPPPPSRVKVHGVQIDVKDAGQFNLLGVDGRLTRVTPEQYQARIIQELTALVPSLAEFRDRWLEPSERRDLMQLLSVQGLLPEKLREAAAMDDYDLFDVLAALAYGIEPLTRAERAARFGTAEPDWLVPLPQATGNVIRAIVRQFQMAGTEALETPELWSVDEVKREHGLVALRQGGSPAELLRKTKETLFAA